MFASTSLNFQSSRNFRTFQLTRSKTLYEMDKSLELILDHLFEALALNFRPLKFRGDDANKPLLYGSRQRFQKYATYLLVDILRGMCQILMHGLCVLNCDMRAMFGFLFDC